MHRKTYLWFVAGGAVALALAVAPGCRPPAEAPHGDQPSAHDHEDAHDHEHGPDDGHGHSHSHDAGNGHTHGPDGGHSHDDNTPTGYRQGVARIQAGAAQIAKAIGAGDFEAAHSPLDDVDPIIGQLMLLAKKSGVPRKDWEAVNVARRELRAEFDKLHAAIDAGERPDYAAAQDTIQDRLQRLQTVSDQLARQGSAPPVKANAKTSKDATP